MSLTRRRFTQILASTLFLHHLPSFAQSVKFWASLTLPEAQNITRIVSAGAPADLLLLAVAPEKMVGFSSFDFARQALIPLPEHIRQFPRLGRLAGRASTLSLEGPEGKAFLTRSRVFTDEELAQLPPVNACDSSPHLRPHPAHDVTRR